MINFIFEYGIFLVVFRPSIMWSEARKIPGPTRRKQASSYCAAAQWRSHSLSLGSADPDESPAIPYKFTVHHCFYVNDPVAKS